MNKVGKDIFRAIHEGKWVSIEYRNKSNELTSYWVAVKNIIPFKNILIVDGLNLSSLDVCELIMFYDSIKKTEIIEGSICDINKPLLDDIALYPKKYSYFFNNIINLKILNYLSDCNKMDNVPYKLDYMLIKKFDDCNLKSTEYKLSDIQYKEIIQNFQYESNVKNEIPRIKQICLNIMSIPTNNGLYVLAYKKLYLDVASKSLKASDEITICNEFTIDGLKSSIRQFLCEDDLILLDDFEENVEEIKNRITINNPQIKGVDDMPYIMGLAFDLTIDLNYEYNAILEMYSSNSVTIPIKAFFGELTAKPDRRKDYPIALLNKKVNLDQLLAIHNALKYPQVYVQGPPGSGKTNTIINTIIAAFFNDKKILITSYNNHPVDGVVDKLQSIKYKDMVIPFPIIRLGNNEKIKSAAKYIKELYKQTKSIKIYDGTLERNKKEEKDKIKALTNLLKNHEKKIDLLERKSTIEKLINSSKNMPFMVSLQSKQLDEVNKEIKAIGEIKDEDAIDLINQDESIFYKFMYYTSARYIKRLEEPKYEDFLKIINLDDETLQVAEFNKYLSNDENLQKFLKVFPVVATTNICAHKLGEPKQYFDMVIMDESSQCNTAISLVPIIRGESLMLVGDPQQLKPVILLDPKDNLALRKKYGISPDYDYIDKSIYQVFITCDPVSDEVLLSYHYRCHPQIIGFNNKKYYNNKLIIKSSNAEQQPLIFVDYQNNESLSKNTSLNEAEGILEYIKRNKDKKIGIITPFVNQKKLIKEMLEKNNISEVACGTVHAFQGDEKDIILFSLALTGETSQKTYDWLKCNRELINVATSRASEKLIMLTSHKEIERLHKTDTEDDIYELCNYIKTNGTSKVSGKAIASRALGIKPYSTETEEGFLDNLNHALDNINLDFRKYVVHKEVPISQVFNNSENYNDLFFTGRFDFVVYERIDGKEMPVFAIELDGREHLDNELVKIRDQKKNGICKNYSFELIRIPNTYYRRYNYVKDILISFFAKKL